MKYGYGGCRDCPPRPGWKTSADWNAAGRPGWVSKMCFSNAARSVPLPPGMSRRFFRHPGQSSLVNSSCECRTTPNQPRDENEYPFDLQTRVRAPSRKKLSQTSGSACQTMKAMTATIPQAGSGLRRAWKALALSSQEAGRNTEHSAWDCSFAKLSCFIGHPSSSPRPRNPHISEKEFGKRLKEKPCTFGAKTSLS